MRSYEPIEATDLERLARISAQDRERFFRTRPEYAGRLLCVALCQGAGQHAVDVANGRPDPNGVKDFDVWSFFAAVPGTRFPAARRMTHADFGPSRFGRQEDAGNRFRHYQGRRVDLLLRALPVPVGAEPVSAVRAWLCAGGAASARALALKGVVVIDPPPLRARVIWPS